MSNAFYDDGQNYSSEVTQYGYGFNQQNSFASAPATASVPAKPYWMSSDDEDDDTKSKAKSRAQANPPRAQANPSSIKYNASSSTTARIIGSAPSSSKSSAPLPYFMEDLTPQTPISGGQGLDLDEVVRAANIQRTKLRRSSNREIQRRRNIVAAATGKSNTARSSSTAAATASVTNSRVLNPDGDFEQTVRLPQVLVMTKVRDRKNRYLGGINAVIASRRGEPSKETRSVLAKARENIAEIVSMVRALPDGDEKAADVKRALLSLMDGNTSFFNQVIAACVIGV